MKTLKNISFGLLAIMALLLAITTIIEDVQGSDFVREYIYNSPIFVLFWGALTFFGLLYILKKKRYKNPSVFLIHIAFIIVLLGALVTWVSGKKGIVHLRENQNTHSYTTTENETLDFPFAIALHRFTVEYYPGTQTPQDFLSEITFYQKDNSPISAKVSMNNIVSFEGYRFYQNGYDKDERGTILSISYDPYGVGITYFGYVFLLFSLLFFFFGKQSKFYRLLRNPLLRNTTILCVLLFSTLRLNATPTKNAPKVLPQATAEQFCDLYLLYNGQVCPLQTLAKDFTVKLYGKNTYKGYSSEQVFTGWLFFYLDWVKVPMIKIKSPKTQKLLKIDSEYATFKDFFNQQRRYKLYNSLANIYQGQKVTDKKGIRKADEKYNIIAMLRMGKLIKIFPYKTPQNILDWYAPNDKFPKTLTGKKKIFINKAVSYLLEMAQEHDYQKFEQFCKKIKLYQEKEVGISNLPHQQRFQAEKIYNKTDYSKYLFMLFLAIGIFTFAYFIQCLIARKELHKTVIITLNIVLVLGFLYLSFFISLRGYVSQHFPTTNGYETMQFLAWASLLATLLLQFKFRIILPFGFLFSGLTLLVATLGQSSPKITPLMPVLSSPLLSIHVATIMISYLLFAFIMFNGIAGLLLHFFTKNCKEQIKRLQIISQILLYPAVFLLTIGTFIGAVWANVSWGRYWGWDPKEVWALITMLIYSFPLHSVSIKRFQSPLFFHAFAIIAFLSVLFTYFGVNFILGGIHSYAGG